MTKTTFNSFLVTGRHFNLIVIRAAYRGPRIIFEAAGIRNTAGGRLLLTLLYQFEQQLKKLQYAGIIDGKITTVQADQPYIFDDSKLYFDLFGPKSYYDIIKLIIISISLLMNKTQY